MSLLSRLREKQFGKVATATSATFATLEAGEVRTVAAVAAVAVANSKEHKAAPLTAEEEKAIQAWLSHIQVDDPAIIAEVLDKCRADPGALAYFLCRTAEVPSPDTDAHQPDDRHTCRACRHLRAGHCTARRHGIEGEASFRFRPHPDLPRRCAGFVGASSC